jgi:hypothetical protein
MRDRNRFAVFAVCAAAALLVPTSGGLARELIEVPRRVVPTHIMVNAHGQRDYPTVLGKSITVRIYTGPWCQGVPPGRLRGVRVVERPKTASRPFKSAILTPYVEYPAHVAEVDPATGTIYSPACARDAMPSVHRRIKLKRPGEDLIFFDGSMSPPRRFPVGIEALLARPQALNRAMEAIDWPEGRGWLS